MARRKQNRFMSQAALEALVRYGGEESGLKALIRQAEDDRQSTIAQAHGTAQGIQSAVDQARPQVAGVYRSAQRNQRHIAETVAHDVAGLPAVPDAIRAGLEWEQGSQAARVGESRAAALTDLSQRKVAARSGEQFAVQAAQRGYRSEVGKVLQRAQDLAGEKGAFTAATARELQQAAQQRQDTLANQRATRRQQDRNSRRTAAQQERNSLRSAGIDPATGQPIPGGRLDPKASDKKKWAPAATQAKASDTLQEALTHARDLKTIGSTRAEAAFQLQNGAKDQTNPLYDVDQATGKQTRQIWKKGEKGNEDGSKTGTPKTQFIPGLPKIKSQLLLSAALDVAYDGHLSRKNAKLLHENGIRIGPLGVPTYRQWKRKRTSSASRPALAPGANGQLRPT